MRLQTDRTKLVSCTNTIPRCRWLRRLPAQLAHGRHTERNALEYDDTLRFSRHARDQPVRRTHRLAEQARTSFAPSLRSVTERGGEKTDQGKRS